MNRRSYGYLVRALNEFASLTARCGLNAVHHPVPAKVPIRIDGLSRRSSRLSRRSARNTLHVIENHPLCHFGKK
jgi:hypothetical protein